LVGRARVILRAPTRPLLGTSLSAKLTRVFARR
jgi:hypothetical protein